MKFFKKPFIYSIVFSVLLLSFTAYTLLDVFIIPHSLSSATTSSSMNSQSSGSNTESSSSDSSTDSTSEAVVTDSTYQDSNINITISTIRENNTSIYVADIQLSSAKYFKTALANNTFGTNITAKTSVTASANHAILAINGDFYGANAKGYVIKNGTLYRSTVRDDSEYDDLVIYQDGSLGIINEAQISASQLVSDGVTQLFTFGPTLVESGTVCVSTSAEVDQSMSSNPRTAIGIIDNLHYIIVVSDGRTSASTGLSLYQLAQVMKNYGCTTAYNLDGGGSSTLYFNGKVINNPTTNGKTITERAVSDIAYIGY